MKNPYTNFFNSLEGIFPSDKYFIHNYDVGETKVCSLDGTKLIETFYFSVFPDKLVLTLNNSNKTIFIKKDGINIWLDIESLKRFIENNVN